MMDDIDPFVAGMEYRIRNLEKAIKDEQNDGIHAWLKGQKSGFEYAIALHLDLKRMERDA